MEHVHSCFYCGLPLTRSKRTRDHCTPIKRGGLKNKANIVISCLACNQDKGTLTTEEYRVVIAYRKGLVKGSTVVFHGELKSMRDKLTAVLPKMRLI